jgi:Fe-S-cluster formation regulator IscX/YfhJ
MAILKFRIAWEDDDAIYRDVMVKHSQHFTDLHQIILKAFEFDEKHDATFFRSNEKWQRGREISKAVYEKNYVDTVQWHLEDIVRDPVINPAEGIELKRRIDKSNQVRTDFVEQIDDYFLAFYANIIASPNATLNTESPAWAIDRLSILILKIYHMREETLRTDASVDHIDKCQLKLNILLEQQDDLSNSIDELLIDIESGKKKMKVYRQMKMYNDPALNPVLYNTKEK